ncbi:hypothetical protein BGX38DRAFT_1275086 [Terfezia claveryi]|nr:hypothetical protein BGX38DRAFT_1275086 [Terfezia claveryi]
MKEKSIQPARDAIQPAHNTFTYQQHRVVVQTNNTSSPALQSESQQTVHETEVDDSQAHSQAQLHTITSISSTSPPFNQNQQCNSVDVGLDEYPSSQTPERQSSYSIEPPLKKRHGRPKKTFTMMDVIPQPQANVPDCKSPESDIDETQLMEARPDTIHISSTRNHYGTRTNCKSSTKVIEELAYKHQETSAKNRIEALRNGKVKLQNKKVSGWSQRT